MIPKTLKLALLLGFAAIPAFASDPPTLVNGLVIPGETTDRCLGAAGANFNRLGGPFSDLFAWTAAES